ncbi:MAG: hypothetical protein AAFV88_14745 [Planctomycetota bacterium]
MNRLRRFIGRFHCIEAHQSLVIDGLRRIDSPAGQRLTPWLLRYHRDLLRGVLDPDRRFRDYHNHVLHVSEGYWGGAPRVAHQWYDRLERELSAERFRDVAHAAGVLCHYLIDVINPLHTVHSPYEAAVHFAFELSVQQSLPRIRQRVNELGIRTPIQISSKPGWLGSLMMHAARLAHDRAGVLLSRYAFDVGLRKPSRALDPTSIDLLAELHELATTAIAVVLERAAEQFERESGFPIPHCYWRWAWPTAIRRVPRSLVQKARYAGGCRRQLCLMAQELDEHGVLKETLPAEVDIKQRVHAVYHSERRLARGAIRATTREAVSDQRSQRLAG